MGVIYLSELMNQLQPLKNYKIHFAIKSGGLEPLDEYLRDFESWKDWNTYSDGKDVFNEKYIFSLIRFYPENDTWLFGGIWEVISTDRAKFKKGGCNPYTIRLCEDYQKYIGRLKILYKHSERTKRNKMEVYFPRLIVKEVLQEEFTIQTFPGYRNFDVPFSVLEKAMQQSDWKDALSVKGIYLITDISTGRKYVGQAPGEHGFWQRWSDYIANGHGGDVDLMKLVEQKGMDYVRANYKFTILETIGTTMTDEIDERENYWKRVLMSRLSSIGHNRN